MKKLFVKGAALLLIVMQFTTLFPIVVNATENTSDTSKENQSSTFESEKTFPTISSNQASTSTSELEATKTEGTVETIEQEKLHYKLTFITDKKNTFTTGESEIERIVEENQKIKIEEIPIFAGIQQQLFVGWQYNKELLTTEELAQKEISKDCTVTAIFKQQASPRIQTVDASIKDAIALADKTKVIVTPNPVDNTQAYQEYPASDAGVKSALNDLYHGGSGGDYALYIGTNVSLTAATVAKVPPVIVDATNATFSALEGKVNNLVITGNSDDPITQDQVAPTGSKTLAWTNTAHFGSSITLRNLNYTGSTFYLNGHNMSLNGGSVGNGLSIYGGTDSGDVTGNPRIAVNSTGSGTWNIYGGNQNGGALTGSTDIVINNTRSGLNNLYGGANIGTIVGNTSITVTDSGGRINTIYGGGNGTSTTNTANVTGNVSTKIEVTNALTGFQLSTYYGGVQYGNVGGKVVNTISGYGRWYNTGQRFIGGSSRGNIGTNRVSDGIETNIDTSLYSSGRADFEGGNQYSGTIIGDIKNTVKAGTNTAGGINDFNGGAGNNVSKFNKAQIGASNETTYDGYTPQQRADLAQAAASFKVYGNITSKLVSGSFNSSASYSTAAGRGGYVEGNTTIEVGTANTDGSLGGDGMAYSGAKPTSLDYSTTNKSRGNSSGWDIVGGGGYPASNDTWDIYIKGDTKTILNNTIARWTYGGSFSGVVEGNTSNTLNGGITDTLEGTGYQAARVYGNGHTTVNNGQVDWFLSGGGWNDAKNVGNVGVTVYEGVINASMGASYGASGGHTITGNSDNRIYGGNFSGTPRTGSNGFSGGITNAGSLLGNASLLIDLRNYTGDFKLPGNTYITGGRPYGQNTNLGTDIVNTITLNIFTKVGTDSLNGASIYGDGGTNAANTKNGKILMNIQAVDSSIGNLYATQYSNISGGKIVRDVTANVQGATSINGLSGGAANDNFTNTVVNASTNKARFNFGTNIDGTNNYQTNPINVTGIGIVNFTQLNVTNGIKLLSNGGNIKNGLSATAGNHGTTYNEFGDIHLSKNAGIGLTNATNLISAGKLTVEDKSTLESPPGTGKINISDFETPDLSKDELTWLKNTSNDPASLVDSSGTWFGAMKAYQVLTINPTVTNANKVSPANFHGIEKATGKTFIGDNDITKGTNGYGIAIPGSIIDYEVEAPGISEGEGSLFHNVTDVKTGNSPLTIKAWGTETAGTKVQKGRLLIPSANGISPEITFEPETIVTGSWLYSGTIRSTKVNDSEQIITEKPDSSTGNWQSPNGEYSYQIKVKYSNKAEIIAKNSIVTEQEAAMLTDKQAVLDLMEAKGRPFFKDSLTPAMLNEIRQPLATDQISRKHVISYQVGTSTANQKSIQANLIVVRNGSTIASDRSFAVYAKDVRLSLEKANNLTDQSALNNYTEAQVIFADNRANAMPTIPEATFNAIKNVNETELLKNVSANYSYQQNGLTAEKMVNIAIAGTLELKEVPTNFDFGKQKISTTEQSYWPTITGNLIVKDTRGSERDAWRVTVTEKRPLTSGTNQLTGGLSFINGTTKQVLGSAAVIVEEKSMTSNGEYTVNQEWGQQNNKGIKATISVEKQKVGSYEGTLSWSLVSAPGNP